MTAETPKTPKSEQFVKLPRDLIHSDAWRSQSINTRRLIDFLMEEHMAHGGAENGKLKAPNRHLKTFGIGARYITKAICEAEELGLVDCRRGGLRVASSYALTWLPLHDGSPTTNRWRTYRSEKPSPPRISKIKKLLSHGKAGLPPKGKPEGDKLPREGKVDSAKLLPSKGKALSRRSYQEGMFSSVLEEGCILLDPIGILDEGIRRPLPDKPDVSDLPSGKKIRVVI